MEKMYHAFWPTQYKYCKQWLEVFFSLPSDNLTQIQVAALCICPSPVVEGPSVKGVWRNFTRQPITGAWGQ